MANDGRCRDTGVPSCAPRRGPSRRGQVRGLVPSDHPRETRMPRQLTSITRMRLQRRHLIAIASGSRLASRLPQPQRMSFSSLVASLRSRFCESSPTPTSNESSRIDFDIHCQEPRRDSCPFPSAPVTLAQSGSHFSPRYDARRCPGARHPSSFVAHFSHSPNQREASRCGPCEG